MIKIIDKITIIIFIMILASPLILTNRKPGAISASDNRELAGNPMIESRNGTKLSDAVDNYYNDRIGLRAEYINLNGRISYQLFNQSPVDKIIVGKDGWLFYNGEMASDGVPISQYLGIHVFSEDELKSIAENLTTVKKYLEERNCEFVLYIAPNKERVYSDYMPDKYQNARVSDVCSTDQLVSYLRENTDIRVVWPYEYMVAYLREYPDEPLYYHLDSHWNELGGYIGAKALLDELDIEIESAENISKSRIEEINTGDLRRMMSVGDWLIMLETGWQIVGYPDIHTVIDEEELYGHWYYHNKNKDSRALLFVRDSFAEAMRLEIGASFNTVDMCHQASYSPELITEDNPDIFVYEIVERNVPWLKIIELVPED